MKNKLINFIIFFILSFTVSLARDSDEKSESTFIEKVFSFLKEETESDDQAEEKSESAFIGRVFSFLKEEEKKEEPVPAPEVKKVEVKKPVLAPEVKKVEVKKPVPAPEVKKVEVKKPVLAPEVKKVEVKKPVPAPEVKKVEVKKPVPAPEVKKVEVKKPVLALEVKQPVLAPPVMQSYEQCSEENNYLEGSLEKFFQSLSSSVTMDVTYTSPANVDCTNCSVRRTGENIINRNIDVLLNSLPGDGELNITEQCIQRSLYTTQKNLRYGYCEENKMKLKKRPCISYNYVKTVSHIYGQVSSCLGFSPREFFHIFNHEGRFHPSIKSGGAQTLCAGQLTSVSVKDVHRFFNQYKAHKFIKKYVDPEKFKAKNNDGQYTLDSFDGLFPSPQCAAVKRLLKNKPYTKSFTRCERVDFPEGWTRCFMYGAIYYLSRKEAVEKELKTNNMLPEETLEKEKIIVRLASVAYNAGDPRQLIKLAKSFWEVKKLCSSNCPPLKYDELVDKSGTVTVRCKGVQKQVENFKDFIEQCSHNKDSKRVEEIASYDQDLGNDVQEIEDRVVNEVKEDVGNIIDHIGVRRYTDSSGKFVIRCKKRRYVRRASRWRQIMIDQEVPVNRGLSGIISRCYNDSLIRPEANDTEESINRRLQVERDRVTARFSGFRYDLERESLGELKCASDIFYD